MTDLAAIARQLTDALDPTGPPIAVALVDEAPPGVAPFEGSVPGGCVFWQEAAGRAFTTTAVDHRFCAVGIHTHHLPAPSEDHAAELGKVLEVMAGLEYLREDDLARVPVLEKAPRAVVYSPLADAPVEPDVVLLFVDSRGGLILAEAIEQVEGGRAPALGRPACAVVPAAVDSGRAALSLGCCGARAYLDRMADDVALWALPGRRLAEYAGRIVALARANEVLGRFHRLRGEDIAAGREPTIADSLARLEAAGS